MIANSGGRQSLGTQQGISLIFIICPAILITLLFVVAVIFPITGKEFAVIQKDIARRKGEDSSAPTEEEKRICEKVTGFAYDNLWDIKNSNKK
ncbi:oligogalacturonide transporter [Butyrivibrio sp. INlla16]|nr:oligogalacturonide transporter [Butyrivibrio sp. INlla16]